jgi:predicted N-formylglutamate amidohydrolase
VPETSEPPLPLVLSCEHGGNRVPARWRGLFRGAQHLLDSHRGWDPGALPLARALARSLGAPLVATTVTRLLVEPNRSLGHPQLFSRVTRELPADERAALVERYWRPHRARVEAAAREGLRRHGRVIHLGVHSFTPVLDGEVRDVEIGVLYDPARHVERDLCRAWIRDLRRALPRLRIRANAPYRGSADGLTTHLRRALGERYLGIELEVGQALLAPGARGRRRLVEALAATLAERLEAAQPLAERRRGSSSRASRVAPEAGKRTTPSRG